MKPRTIRQPVARSQLNGKLCSYEVDNTTIQPVPLIHRDVRFWLIIPGLDKLLIQGQSYPLYPNTLVSIPSWQISDVVQTDEPLQYKLITYNYDAITRAVEIFSNGDGQTGSFLTAVEDHPVVSLSARDNTIEYLLDTLSGEFDMDSLCLGSSQNPFHSVNLISILVQMIIYYIRLSQRQRTEPDEILTDHTEIPRYIYLYYSEKLALEKLSPLFNCSPSTTSFYLTSSTGPSFLDLLNKIRIGKTTNSIIYMDFMLKKMSELLSYVNESHTSKIPTARIGPKINDYRKVYQKVQNILRIEEIRTVYSMTNYIYRNYADDLNAKDIAHQSSLSVPQMNELLIYQMGQNFAEFLNQVRVNKASELLPTPTKTVLEIVYEVGCNNPRTSTRNFLELEGITPVTFG